VDRNAVFDNTLPNSNGFTVGSPDNVNSFHVVKMTMTEVYSGKAAPAIATLNPIE